MGAAVGAGDSCLRRNDGTVGRCECALERRVDGNPGDLASSALGRDSYPPPNLPLKGGRDELGVGAAVGAGDSCLRRNNEIVGRCECALERRADGNPGDLASSSLGRDSHPPPNLPPQRGEG